MFFFFQAEDGIRDLTVTGVQTCALPIFIALVFVIFARPMYRQGEPTVAGKTAEDFPRSEEHTSELQSQSNIVCRLLLVKKKETRHMLFIVLLNTISKLD